MRAIALIILCGLIWGCKDQITDTVLIQDPLDSGTQDRVPETEEIKASQVDSSLEDGSYPGGTTIDINVYFNGIVNVTGSPRIEIQLNYGQTTFANYESGSGSSILTFSFVALPGDHSAGLEVTSAAVIDLNGGELRSLSGAIADDTLPTPGEDGSLSKNKTIKLGYSDSFSSLNLSSQWTMGDQDNFDMNQNGNVDDDFEISFFQSGGELTLNGRGRDVWQNTHEFLSTYLNDLQGDFDFSVKVYQRSNTNNWTKSGLMLSNDHSNLASGGVYTCSTTQSNDIAVQWASAGDGRINRSSHGHGSSDLPAWIRVVKTGSQVECMYKFSEAGSWVSHPGGPLTLGTLNSTFDFGIFSTSHNRNSSLTVQFDDFVDHDAL